MQSTWLCLAGARPFGINPSGIRCWTPGTALWAWCGSCPKACDSTPSCVGQHWSPHRPDGSHTPGLQMVPVASMAAMGFRAAWKGAWVISQDHSSPDSIPSPLPMQPWGTGHRGLDLNNRVETGLPRVPHWGLVEFAVSGYVQEASTNYHCLLLPLLYQLPEVEAAAPSSHPAPYLNQMHSLAWGCGGRQQLAHGKGWRQHPSPTMREEDSPALCLGHQPEAQTQPGPSCGGQTQPCEEVSQGLNPHATSSQGFCAPFCSISKA